MPPSSSPTPRKPAAADCAIARPPATERRADQFELEAGCLVALEVVGATFAGVVIAFGVDEAEFEGLVAGDRDQKERQAAGFEHAKDFGDGEVVFEHVFEHVAGDDEFEGLVWEGQVAGVEGDLYAARLKVGGDDPAGKAAEGCFETGFGREVEGELGGGQLLVFGHRLEGDEERAVAGAAAATRADLATAAGVVEENAGITADRAGGAGGRGREGQIAQVAPVAAQLRAKSPAGQGSGHPAGIAAQEGPTHRGRVYQPRSG